ncbi:Uncharacterised protein [Klebsiella pneumoniae]|nr:Uncharacterised protein [Klebsiella pneumoniae]
MHRGGDIGGLGRAVARAVLVGLEEAQVGIAIEVGDGVGGVGQGALALAGDLAPDRRPDRPGADHRDLDAHGCQLAAQGVAHSLLGELRGGVGAQVGNGDRAEARGDVHQARRAATAQQRQDRPGHRELADQVDFQLAPQQVTGDAFQRRGNADPGVVHQAPEPGIADFLRHLRGGPANGFLVGDIDQQRADPAGRAGVRQALAILLAAHPGDHLETLFGQVQRGFPAEAAGGAGDQYVAALGRERFAGE